MPAPDSFPPGESFTNQSKEDFSKAYWKGFWNSILSWLRRSNNELLPFDEVRKRIPMRGQHYRGLMQIETSRIIGSESRFNDFDRAFLPRQTHTRERWESIDRAYFQDVILPPIDVYKVGDVFLSKMETTGCLLPASAGRCSWMLTWWKLIFQVTWMSIQISIV